MSGAPGNAPLAVRRGDDTGDATRQSGDEAAASQPAGDPAPTSAHDLVVVGEVGS